MAMCFVRGHQQKTFAMLSGVLLLSIRGRCVCVVCVCGGGGGREGGWFGVESIR